MGIIVSTVTAIVSLVVKVKQDKKKDKLEEQEAKTENIKKPIVPPKYYTTIEARRKNVKEGPYTVENIASSLRNDLVPVGYSLEQLRKVGFGADVTEYERRNRERRETNNKNLIEGLEKLKKEIEKGFVSEENMSQEDRELVKKYNIFNPVERAKYISKIDQWIGLAKEKVLSEEALDAMLGAFNLKIGDYDNALKQESIKKQNQQLIDGAMLNRDRKVLESVKRGFRNGYGINKI